MGDEEIAAFAAEHGFLAWMRVSAKENDNVDNGMKLLISHLMKNCALPTDVDEDIRLDLRRKKQPDDDNSCC